MPSPRPTPHRLLVVIQSDGPEIYVAETTAGLTNAELALAIASGDGFADHAILEIREITLGELPAANITEDIARELVKVAEDAADNGWCMSNCAPGLLRRFGLYDAVEDRETAEYLNQRQVAA